jgi:hypothetical protein
MRLLLVILAMVATACRHNPSNVQQRTAQTRVARAAEMDSATIERLCVQPDSVRAGRAECVLKDQSPSPQYRLKPVTPP